MILLLLQTGDEIVIAYLVTQSQKSQHVEDH